MSVDMDIDGRTLAWILYAIDVASGNVPASRADISNAADAIKAQPTLPVLRRPAIALGVSGDALLFDANERGPSDDLRLHLEAVARMSPEEKQVVRSLLEDA